MDACLVLKQNFASCFPSLQYTYRKHVITLYAKKQSSLLPIGLIVTYYSIKLLVLLLKQTIVDGCMPSIEAKLCFMLSISPIYI